MKMTIESTPKTVVVTVELNGDTFRRSWVMDENRYLRTKDKDFCEQAEATGKYSDEMLEFISDILDENFLEMNAVQLAENCEGGGDA